MRYLLLTVLILVGCQNPRYEAIRQTNTISSDFTRSNIDQYIITKIGSLDHEELLVLFYKNTTYLGSLTVVGKTNSVEYNNGDLLSKCNKLNCNGLIISHNHPTQYFAQHSEVDSKTAKTNKAFYDTFHIDVIANIVVTKYDSVWY